MDAGSAGTRRGRLVAASVGVLLVITAGHAAPAAASQRPGHTVSGEATTAQRVIVLEAWTRFTSYFTQQWDCMPDLEIRIVPTAEEHYRGPAGSITAFYRDLPEPIVFVESAALAPELLFHEFAHHLDLSCRIGESRFAPRFKDAQGLPADRPWTAGPSWAAVPAEHLSEAVLAVMGFPSTRIQLTVASLSLVAELGDPRHAVGPAAFAGLTRHLPITGDRLVTTQPAEGPL